MVLKKIGEYEVQIEVDGDTKKIQSITEDTVFSGNSSISTGSNLTLSESVSVGDAGDQTFNILPQSVSGLTTIRVEYYLFAGGNSSTSNISNASITINGSTVESISGYDNNNSTSGNWYGDANDIQVDLSNTDASCNADVTVYFDAVKESDVTVNINF